MIIFLIIFGLLSNFNSLSKGRVTFDEFSLSGRRIRSGNPGSWGIHEEKITISHNGLTEESSIYIEPFPDGELKITLSEPGKVVNAKVEYQHSLNNANDFMEIFLTLGTLKQYRAREVTLTIQGWKPETGSREDWNLLRILKIFCNKIIISDFNDNQPLRIRPPKEYRKVRISERIPIDRLFYIQDRFQRIAEEEVLRSLDDSAVSAQIQVEEISGAHWKVELPANIRKKNIVLLHSTENAQNIIKALLALFALRQNDIQSVFLINSYQGYARQDKEFDPGDGISADILVQALNRFLDYNLAVNVHYGNQTGVTYLPPENRIIYDSQGERIQILPARGRQIYNLNGFVQLAENVVDKIIAENGIEEFKRHPVVIVSPDDGGFLYASEAVELLRKYLREEYGIENEVEIFVGYLRKKRETAREVIIEGEPQILTGLGEEARALELPVSLDNCWIMILDDETSTGATILHGVYYLVKNLNALWNMIYTGVVHGKFSEGLEQFNTGLSPEELESAFWPFSGIDEDRKFMAPKYLVVSNTLPLEYDLTPYPNISTISIQRLIAYAIRKILEEYVPLGP